MNASSPEEIELNKKRKVLERLKDKLAFREAAMTELRAELEQFEANYTMEVGRLYADFDEIEAQIAEEEVKLVPDDEEIKKRAEELRRRAEESAANAEKRRKLFVQISADRRGEKGLSQLSKNHSSRFGSRPQGKRKTHDLMAKLNEAYSAGRPESSEQISRRFPRFARFDYGRFRRRPIRPRDSPDLSNQKSSERIARRTTRRRTFRTFHLARKSSGGNARRQKSDKANG
jgi:hypothetical protein